MSRKSRRKSRLASHFPSVISARTTDSAPSPAETPKNPAASPRHARNVVQQSTIDGYDNFLNRIGLNNDNTLSAGTYEFNLITRNRILLEAAYRGSWIVGSIVDSVAEDMTRAGITVETAEEDANIQRLMTMMTRKRVWQSLQLLIKWGRLYGGALGVIQLEGQDLSTPLNVESVGKAQFKGIIVYDRWQLNPLLTPVIQTGPQMGLPVFYQIVNNLDSTDPIAETMTGQLTVHHSRCIRYTGIDLPFFQAITEMMWGESHLERLWDRLIAFDNATMSTGSLIDRANLRTVGINGFREIIAAGGDAVDGLNASFDMMRRVQVNEGLTLLDKEDVFEQTSYAFSGLADVLLQFGQQLAGASGIPLVRLFGQAPAGLNSNSDGEIRMYYDSINAQQESKLRDPFEVLLKVLWRSTFGRPAPEDLDFFFTPLWQMSAVDKANTAKTNTETILGAHEGGLVPASTAMRELRDSSGDTGLFSNITDEDIEAADAEAPPMPGDPADPTAEKPTAPGESLTSKVPSLGPAPAKDSAWRRLLVGITPKRNIRAWR